LTAVIVDVAAAAGPRKLDGGSSLASIVRRGAVPAGSSIWARPSGNTSSGQRATRSSTGVLHPSGDHHRPAHPAASARVWSREWDERWHNTSQTWHGEAGCV